MSGRDSRAPQHPMQKRYAAFLSYCHADSRWAAWLQKTLEGYRVPSRLVGSGGEFGPVPPRIAPVFRDREELSSASDLGGRITAALEHSDALVVLCSSSAARSPWVNEEIRRFRRLGREARIHCVLLPDESASEATPVFPPALTEALDDCAAAAEPIAADLRDAGDGRRLAVQKLIAGLLGIGLDALRQREAQRRHRRLLGITTASLAGTAFTAFLAMQAHVARNDAQRRQAQAEDLLGFMIDDLRPKLERVGRLDLLDDVGDKALRYFDALPPRDLTDTTLSQQARALTQIGQVRLEQGKHDEALEAFHAAHARAQELSRRAPEDGQRLFDLAQADYWIGLVAWRQRDLDTAERWLVSYRDRSVALAAMAPSRFDWQREAAYGHHNLAVLEDSRGRHAGAAAAFEQELALYRPWVKQHPDDTLLRLEAANVASWLGSVSERLGRLADAEAYFLEADQGHAANQAQEPEVMGWIDHRTDTSVLLARLLLRRGKVTEARDILRRTQAAASALSEHDPTNTTWRRSHGNALLALATAELACGSTAAAAAAVDAARPLLAQALDEASDDDLVITSFVRAALLDAEIELQAGRAAEAGIALRRAEAPLARAWQRDPSDALKLLTARHRELEAFRLEASGEGTQAEAQRRAALALLVGDGSVAVPPAFLEQVAALQRSVGDEVAATATESLFERIGGRPLRHAIRCTPVSAGSPATTRNGP